MHLPEESLDEIFSHLPLNNGRSLRSCSLVSKSWLEPSRRLLFAHVFTDLGKYHLWLDNISPSNTALLRHVRSFEYSHSYTPPVVRLEESLLRQRACDPCFALNTFRDYLPAFRQLQSFTLYNAVIEPTVSDHLELFANFQHSLSSLSFGRVSITWSSFVAILGYFPHLSNLTISEPSFQMDDRPVPQLPHVLHGRLLVSLVGHRVEGERPFFDRFPGLKQEYEELEFLTWYQPSLVAPVEASLKSLKITAFSLGSTPDLSRCLELRQLEIAAVNPQRRERALISSITSTNLRKIIFAGLYTSYWTSPSEHPCWMLLDDTLCELVDRLRASGLRHTLEVEIRSQGAEFGEEWREKLLPKFKEKGLVRLVSESAK